MAQVQVVINPATGAQVLLEPVLLPLPTVGCPVEQVPAPESGGPVSDGNDYNRICPQDFMGTATTPELGSSRPSERRDLAPKVRPRAPARLR